MSYQQRLITFILPRLLAKSCPATIPRSGDKGRKVDCYLVLSEGRKGPDLLLTSIAGDQVSALEYRGDTFDTPTTVSVSDIDPRSIRVTHFFGIHEIDFFGALDVALGLTLRMPYAAIRAFVVIDSIRQYIFNRRTLVVRRRLTILRDVVDLSRGGSKSVNEIDLMTKRYGHRWSRHPKFSNHYDEIRFFLDGLADTGELEKVDSGSYRATGHALKSLEEADAEDRKHKANLRVQFLLAFLTLISAVMAAAQASLIKLPTLLNLS